MWNWVGTTYIINSISVHSGWVGMGMRLSTHLDTLTCTHTCRRARIDHLVCSLAGSNEISFIFVVVGLYTYSVGWVLHWGCNESVAAYAPLSSGNHESDSPNSTWVWMKPSNLLHNRILAKQKKVNTHWFNESALMAISRSSLVSQLPACSLDFKTISILM